MYSWPIYPQIPLNYSDTQVICAAKIYTANSPHDVVECFAYSPRGKAFIAAGTRKEMIERYPNASIRDLGKMVVLPGLYDSHGHIMQYGAMQESVNLFGASSIDGKILTIDADR